MCGIAGIVDLRRPVVLQSLQQMTDALAHRGPDGEGHWISQTGNVGLGHRRLSIIDLSEAGHQPMHFAQGRYTITYNGEIYNYLEIRALLQKQGFVFHSESDTEVLLALYHQIGSRCLERLDGMFAFAIWDAQTSTLFCARDRFGEKPFYYHYLPGERFVFASEMKALWAFGIDRVPNKRLWLNYLQGGFVENPTHDQETFFQGIHKLPAAHQLVIDAKGDLKCQPYWQLAVQEDNTCTEALATQTFYQLFEQSVKRRLRADVPIGSSLSGGLDSSSIVCLIDQLNPDKQIAQKTFSARFDGFAKDEGAFMHEVLAQVNAEPFFTHPTASTLLQAFDQLCYHQEEPFGSASILAQWEVMRLAKEKGVIVLLDGQGADESLAGYPHYYPVFWRELQKQNPTLLAHELNAYQALYPNNAAPALAFAQSDQLPTNRLKHWLKQTPLYAFYARYRNRHTTLLSFYGKDTFFADDFLASFTTADHFHWPSALRLNDALRNDTTGYGLEVLLRYADRNAMAHSREVRLPFLNHELVAFLFTLPASFKIKDAWTKYIQRRTFEPILPPAIAWRKDKIGYEPPQQDWLQYPDLQQRIAQGRAQLVSAQMVKPEAATQVNPWAALMAAYFLK
ncbi:MAG TPA: asparagine synthase (glutamine-hydrolyzing) [Microscillaceae bacterium]|nr:asparagine synthase (glutamine-hydrolyzing) [Microscillaceae bacterium]